MRKLLAELRQALVGVLCLCGLLAALAGIFLCWVVIPTWLSEQFAPHSFAWWACVSFSVGFPFLAGALGVLLHRSEWR